MQEPFFLADLLSRLSPFFCSTALQAFFRPDHRFPMPTRAEAVRAGRRSAIDGALRRFQARALTALSTAADWMKTGRKCPLVVECLLWFCSRELMSLPDPPFSTRSRGAGRNMASGFRCRYVPNALKKRSVHEESRGHRGPSRQGQHSAARCGEGNSINLRRLERQPQRSIGTSCR